MTSVSDYVRREVEARWYGRAGWLWVLAPLSWLYRRVAERRRNSSLSRLARDDPAEGVAESPVVVVGNIVVGGTGKTPVVMDVVRRLRELDAKPGVVARGYGANSATWPRVVTPQSDPRQCGDEAVELATQLRCPVVVGPDRAAAARWLHEYFDCDVIVSDDGLQHYRLRRDLEIAIVDAERQHGNGQLLPVGPLREPVVRLESVDCVIETARSPAAMPAHGLHPPVPRLQGLLRAVSATHLRSQQTLALGQAPFVGNHCVALSAIGNPERFHDDLLGLGCTLTLRALADHDSYASFTADWPAETLVVTTGKDAVKLAPLAQTNARGWLDQVWVLNRQLVFSEVDDQTLDHLLHNLLDSVDE